MSRKLYSTKTILIPPHVFGLSFSEFLQYILDCMNELVKSENVEFETTYLLSDYYTIYSECQNIVNSYNMTFIIKS